MQSACVPSAWKHLQILKFELRSVLQPLYIWGGFASMWPTGFRITRYHTGSRQRGVLMTQKCWAWSQMYYDHGWSRQRVRVGAFNYRGDCGLC